MMEKNAKIYVAGHKGMVGSAILRELQRQGYTLIPLSVYLKDGRMKMSLGVCVGKHLHDKRDAMAKRDVERDIHRAMREQNR